MKYHAMTPTIGISHHRRRIQRPKSSSDLSIDLSRSSCLDAILIASTLLGNGGKSAAVCDYWLDEPLFCGVVLTVISILPVGSVRKNQVNTPDCPFWVPFAVTMYWPEPSGAT